jgi:transcriptional regulator with XRE-family HTH domain
MGLSPAQLAERLGVGRTTYSNWEMERPTKPNFPAEEAMAELCAQLPGLTLDYIYLGKVDTLRTELAIRVLAREKGLDPDAPNFPRQQVVAELAGRGA